MMQKKNFTVLLNLVLLIYFFSLSALYAKEVEPEIRVITDMQDKYNALTEIIPAICMLPASATSAVSADIVSAIDQKLARQMVLQGAAKPVVMNKYLSGTFLNKKAESSFALLQAIADERYVVPLEGVCKPYIFKNGAMYVLRLAFYHLKGSGYPVEIFRTFTDTQELATVIDSCLAEFVVRYFAPERTAAKKKVLLTDFTIEIRKLVELASGEFEFVSAPFIEQDGVTLKDGDEYFSSLLGFALSGTDMFETLRPADFSEYARGAGATSTNADYICKGRVQLTDQLSFLYVDVHDSRRGTKLLSIKHPIKKISLPLLINAYREITFLIAQKIFQPETFYPVPVISEPGMAFYYKNRLIGWDTLEFFFLPRGMHSIDSGNALNSAVPAHTYYMLLDTEQHMFLDREGKYAWNLLQK